MERRDQAGQRRAGDDWWYELTAYYTEACRDRAGDRPPEIRPSDDAQLPEGNSGRRHNHADGCRSVQHEALDEQTCLLFICLLPPDAGQMARESVIWKRKTKYLPIPDSRGCRVKRFSRLDYLDI